MVYVIGIIGAIGGFVVGQLILSYLLRNRPTEELLSDKSLKWKYGIMNWGLAVLGAWSFVTIYHWYF